MPARNRIYWPLVAVIGTFMLGLTVWSLIDHSIPKWDTACHLMRGYECAGLLQAHHHLTRKIAELVTFSVYYPPVTYYVHGALISIFGPSIFLDVLPRFLWYGLSALSLFFVGEKIFRDRALATLSVAIFSAYPLIFGHSHTSFIDLPMTAMVFLSFWRLLEWKDNPTWRNAVMFGVALGLTLLSKQSAALFVALPLLLLLADSLRQNRKSALMLVSAGAIASAFLLSWMIPNYSACKETVNTFNGSGIAGGSLLDGSFSGLTSYLLQAPECFSYIGLAVFLASLFQSSTQRRLWIVATGTVSALILLNSVPWLPTKPEFRYVMPLMGYAALSTAALLVWLWRRQTILSKALVMIVCGFMALQYLTSSFFRAENFQQPFRNLLQVVGLPNQSRCYTPYVDWGNEWVLKTVDKAANHQPSWLIVLPDKRELQVDGLKYLAKVFDTQVQPTTWRMFTIKGYEFNYPKELLKCPNYYLDMEGSEVSDSKKFVDEKAKERFCNLISILKTSGDFDRIGTKSLPDGNLLVLYKRKPIE